MDQSKPIMMKDLEKKIEETAKNRYDDWRVINSGLIKKAWTDGIKSPEAKEFWQQGMYSEEQLKLAFNAGADRVLSGYDDSGSSYKDVWNTFEDWFNQNKKKETLDEDIYEVRFKVCPIGSYEAENKVADCIGSDDCRALCETCVNYTK